jgi:hypothetical protein
MPVPSAARQTRINAGFGRDRRHATHTRWCGCFPRLLSVLLTSPGVPLCANTVIKADCASIAAMTLTLVGKDNPRPLGGASGTAANRMGTSGNVCSIPLSDSNGTLNCALCSFSIFSSGLVYLCSSDIRSATRRVYGFIPSFRFLGGLSGTGLSTACR